MGGTHQFELITAAVSGLEEGVELVPVVGPLLSAAQHKDQLGETDRAVGVGKEK